MAFIKAKQGALQLANGKQIAVQDISFDTEFDKVERSRLKSQIFNDFPEITIGTFGKVKATIELVASGNSSAPVPKWAGIYEYFGSLSSNTIYITKDIKTTNKSLIAYVNGVKITLSNVVATSLNASGEAGNIPKVEVEFIGIVSAVSSGVLNPAPEGNPVMCSWTIQNVATADVLSFNVSVDLKVEKIYKLETCNPILMISEVNKNIEVVIYGNDLATWINRAKNGTAISGLISNNGSAGNKVELDANMYVQDVKLGENNNLATLTITGKGLGDNFCKFS